MTPSSLTAIDLCAGAGGLSLGLARAGFWVRGVETDADAAATYRTNVGPCVHVDLRAFVPTTRVDLVAAGVPCQPFSQAGDGRGTQDPRGNLYRDWIRVADQAGATAILLENVPGLLRAREPDGRLTLDVLTERCVAAGYVTRVATLDAADFGVPQHRRRVFVAGFRHGLEAEFAWPTPTHGAPPGAAGLLPYVSMREALRLGGVPDGGILDRPSPTISAGGTGGGGGAEPLVYAPTRRRIYAALRAVAAHGVTRFGPRECAALQTFPATFRFCGGRGSQHRQIGNAVPPDLAYVVATRVAAACAGQAARR